MTGKKQYTPEEREHARAVALLRMKATLVTLFDNDSGSAVKPLTPDVADDRAVVLLRYARFCINAPPDKVWLADVWLWCAARCWWCGTKAREMLEDPRPGLPDERTDAKGRVLDVLDDPSQVRKGEWSPKQANLIRMAFRGEMTSFIIQLARSWRAEFIAAADKKGALNKAGTVVIDQISEEGTKRVEVPPKKKPKLKVKVKVKRRQKKT